MTDGILLALPGTSSGDGACTLAGVEAQFHAWFPDIPTAWAFTSSGVRRKLREAGRPAASPGEAMAALKAQGVNRVAVKSLHFAGGMEYSELREVVLGLREGEGRFERIELSEPLLDAPDDFERTMRHLLSDLPAGTGDGDTLLLVAHGSRRPEAQASYARAEAVCRRFERPIIFKTLLMDAGFQDVIRECREAGLRKVVLAPLMVVAGSSARNEIAGSGPDSLASALGREGIACTPMIKGLGDNREVVRLWIEDVERRLDAMAADDGPSGVKR